MQTAKSKSRSYQDLDGWELAINLGKEVYQITTKFPASENFGLINPMRRATRTIPSNIAEGQGRNSAKEFRQFLASSLGSVAELETQPIIAQEIDYLPQEDLHPFRPPSTASGR